MKTLLLTCAIFLIGCKSRTDTKYVEDVNKCQILALAASKFYESHDKENQIYSIINYVEINFPNLISFDEWIVNRDPAELTLFSKRGLYLNGKAYTVAVYRNGEWRVFSDK